MAKVVQNRAKSRVKRLSFRLGSSRQLDVTFRRFRTRAENRSKLRKQFVTQLPLTTYREVAVAYKHRSKRRGHKVNDRKLVAWPSALIVIGLIGAIYFALNLQTPANVTLVGSSYVSASPLTSDAPTTPKTMPRSQPMGLRIPAIDLSTSVIPTGLKPTGEIAMPDGFDVTGWYDKSPTPGELGPSVIVGHLDSTKGIAVFWRLHELNVGDTVYVDRQDGTTATFKIDDIEQYSQDNFPTSQVYGNIDHAGLRLITCGGTFSTVTHHYSDNTVVYASLQ